MNRPPGNGNARRATPPQAEEAREAPPLLARAEVVIGNAIAPFGVIALGWPAFTVVSLYVLDGWLCILGLGASLMIRNRDELRAMVPKGYGTLHRLLFLATCVVLVEAILSMFAVIPGIIVLSHMESSPGDAIGRAFDESGALISVGLLVASHVMRTVRTARGSDEGVAALDPKSQFALYAARMGLMMALAWLAAPGLLVPLYVTAIAALFTYSDLYPQRFVDRLERGQGGPTGSGGGRRQARSEVKGPRLPR